LEGTIESAPTIDRKKGFQEVIKGYPELKIVHAQTGDFTRTKGKEVMEAFLKEKGHCFDALFAHNDDMAIGAIQAMEEYGIRPGTDVIIVSVDAVRAAFEAMIEGKLNCTVECNPLLGRAFFDAVEAIVAGKGLPKRIAVEEGVFPQEVAREVLPTRKY
jgi:simple sugar transport system substrate-binding protein